MALTTTTTAELGPWRSLQQLKPKCRLKRLQMKAQSGAALLGGGIAEASTATPTLRELCGPRVPSYVLDRAEEAGLKFPTSVQLEALPVALEHRDCIVHAQTGSGKTLAYMLPVLSKISCKRSAVQAIIVVPTRELGIQVARVARLLGGGRIVDENDEVETVDKTSVSVMALLDGGTSARQKKWLKAATPQLVIGTLHTVCRMVETHNLKLHALNTIVIDEVDTAVHKGTQIMISNLLSKYSSCEKRQTIFASATVPQHHRFIHDCVQNKWAKPDLTHIYVRPEERLPSSLYHRYMVCDPEEKLDALFTTVMKDAPKAAFIFANEQVIFFLCLPAFISFFQSEKAKRTGMPPKTRLMLNYFEQQLSKPSSWELLILEEDMNINARFANSRRLRDTNFLLFATDLAARGLDVPEVTHVYNFELPSTTVAYIHRAGRTARKPLDKQHCVVTTFVTKQEEFVVRRLEHEISCQVERI